MVCPSHVPTCPNCPVHCSRHTRHIVASCRQRAGKAKATPAAAMWRYGGREWKVVREGCSVGCRQRKGRVVVVVGGGVVWGGGRQRPVLHPPQHDHHLKYNLSGHRQRSSRVGEGVCGV